MEICNISTVYVLSTNAQHIQTMTTGSMCLFSDGVHWQIQKL